MTDAIDFAIPLQVTHLSLPRYAKIMGINPVHFAGGAGSVVHPVGTCNDVWPRYNWQAYDRPSHDELSMAIYGAESDLANILGYQVAPTWIEDEAHQYPRHHRRDLYRMDMTNVRGQKAALKLNYGKFIQGGVRAVTFIDDPRVVYTDADGDGFTDTATLTVLTSVTDVDELKVFFLGTSGEEAWEIRPCRSKSISLGVATFVFDAWLLIDPDDLSMPPTTAGWEALDLDTVTHYVAEVDVYRVYNDFTVASAILYWEQQPHDLTCSICGGVGCAECSFTTQDGCLHVRETDTGMVAAVAASYDANSSSWLSESMTVGRDPDQIMCYYYAGEQSKEYLKGKTFDPLPEYLAQAIAWIATARLERPWCGCGSTVALATYLREDLALTGEAGRFVSEEIITNPLGTRRGEIMAWQRVRGLTPNVHSGGAV